MGPGITNEDIAENPQRACGRRQVHAIKNIDAFGSMGENAFIGKIAEAVLFVGHCMHKNENFANERY